MGNGKAHGPFYFWESFRKESPMHWQAMYEERKRSLEEALRSGEQAP